MATNNSAFAIDVVLQSAAATTGNGTAMPVGGLSGVGLQVTGTFSATITPEVEANGTDYVTIQVINVTTGAISSTITAPGVYFVPLTGANQFRARISAFSSGNVTATGKGVASAPSYVVSALQPATSNIGTVLAGGLAASGAAASGNPVQLGGVFTQHASLPAVATGQMVGLQADDHGTLRTGRVPLGVALTAAANVAAGANNQTLGAAANKMTYLAGFAVTGLGATAAGSITVTTTGLTADLSFVLPIPAGVTAGVTPLVVTFDPPIPASAVNTAIVINVPSFGGGNTTASASAWGFRV
jgi:hypothetical protein